MTYLRLKLMVQSYTQEKFLKFIQRLEFCETLILGVLLKRVT